MAVVLTAALLCVLSSVLLGSRLVGDPASSGRVGLDPRLPISPGTVAPLVQRVAELEAALEELRAETDNDRQARQQAAPPPPTTPAPGSASDGGGAVERDT